LSHAKLGMLSRNLGVLEHPQLQHRTATADRSCYDVQLSVTKYRRLHSEIAAKKVETNYSKQISDVQAVSNLGLSGFYRAMHVVLIARYCYDAIVSRPSDCSSAVCPSVCLSVTLTYREHIDWTSSTLITQIISLGSSIFGATTSVQGEYP